jgi:isocitrate dehydrogenase kinase/phosphatase
MPELLDKIQACAASQVEVRESNGGREIIFRHLYIERRMIPLNLFLQESFDAAPGDAVMQAQLERTVIEYGNAIKDLVAANIFPGDMLWKNFGVTRHRKVVFYDYDEIEYITDCNFRRVPAPRNEEEEMSDEVWYAVARNDVFPETFGPFLLGNDRVRAVFMQRHADLLDPAFWQEHQERIRRGEVMDVFPYAPERRFDNAADSGKASA